MGAENIEKQCKLQADRTDREHRTVRANMKENGSMVKGKGGVVWDTSRTSAGMRLENKEK